MKIFSMIMMKIFVSHALHRMMVVTMALSALMFTACSSSDEEEKAKASNELTVNIKVDDAVSVGKSRALSGADENKIANIHILAFNNATGAMISNGYTTVDNKAEVTLKLAIAAPQNTQLVVYAIANIGNPTLFDAPENKISRTDFENLYIKIDDADQMTAGTYSLCKADGSVFANVENETHAMLISQKQTSYQLIATSNIAVNLNMKRPMPKVILNLYGSNVTLVNYSFGNIPTSDAFLGNETNMTGVEYANTTKKAFDNNISSIEGITFYGLKSYKTANNNITTQRDRIDTNAPENAAYLDIIAAPVSNAEVRYRYRVYLGGVDASGAISPSEFSLLRNHDYYLNIILSDNISGDNRIKLDNTAIVLTPILEDWIDGGTIQYVARK